MNSIEKKELAFTRAIEALWINITSLSDITDKNNFHEACFLCEQLDDKVSEIYAKLKKSMM